MTFTVLLMEPCCEMSADDYDPGPRPVWNRTPGGWPPRCGHADKRVPVLTVHTDKAEAEARHAETLGWGGLKGWIFEGEMPPEGERFRIAGVGGSLSSSRGYYSAGPGRMEFPTVEFAREYAEKTRTILFNIIGDTDLTVRWSSYGYRIGMDIDPGH